MGKTTIASGYILDLSGNATINGNIVLSSSASNILVGLVHIQFNFRTCWARVGK